MYWVQYIYGALVLIVFYILSVAETKNIHLFGFYLYIGKLTYVQSYMCQSSNTKS